MKELDNHIKTTLGRAGLSASEQEVYVAGLQMGRATSAQIIQKLGMPRPTVMAALGQLSELGLCITTARDGRSYNYQMLDPVHLKASVGKRIRELGSVMESLDSLSLGTSEHTSEEAHGQEAVKDLLELALHCNSRKWQIIAPYSNALRHMPKDYIDYFKRVRSERQIESQTLWEEGSSGSVSLKDVLMRKPRYVPKEFGPVEGLILAFDDSLLTIIHKDEKVSAVLIKNKAVTDTFRVVFEMAWRSAR